MKIDDIKLCYNFYEKHLPKLILMVVPERDWTNDDKRSRKVHLLPNVANIGRCDDKCQNAFLLHCIMS